MLTWYRRRKLFNTIISAWNKCDKIIYVKGYDESPDYVAILDELTDLLEEIARKEFP